jgi:hypothetical protein
MMMMMMIIRDVTSCSPLKVQGHVAGMNCLHLQSSNHFYVEDGVEGTSKKLGNFSISRTLCSGT